jgi:hypothetical protein
VDLAVKILGVKEVGYLVQDLGAQQNGSQDGLLRLQIGGGSLRRGGGAFRGSNGDLLSTSGHTISSKTFLVFGERIYVLEAIMGPPAKEVNMVNYKAYKAVMFREA